MCGKFGNLRAYDLHTHTFRKIFSPFTCKECRHIAIICSRECAETYEHTHIHEDYMEPRHDATVYDVTFSKEAPQEKNDSTEQDVATVSETLTEQKDNDIEPVLTLEKPSDVKKRTQSQRKRQALRRERQGKNAYSLINLRRSNGISKPDNASSILDA